VSLTADLAEVPVIHGHELPVHRTVDSGGHIPTIAKIFVTFLRMESKLQIHAEYDTLTGMDQGLWPRFYLQMAALGQLTIGQMGMDEKLEQVRTVLMPELEQLHRSYAAIQQNIQEYESGVASGKYYQVKAGGHTSLDRSVELTIRNDAKQFIIQAKLVYVAFLNSEFLSDGGFSLKTYGLTKKLTQLKEQYGKSKDPQYLPLLNVLEKANALFLNELTDLRGDIEHQSFAIDKFELIKQDGGATVQQPLLRGIILSEKVSFIYENLLHFIEKMMAYYIGLNIERLLPGVAQFCVDDQFDYSQQRYKYTFAFAGAPTSCTARLCLYD